MSLLSALETPFKFLGKVFVAVEEWMPKAISIAAYSEEEAKVLTPAFVAVVSDVEAIAKLATTDGVAAFTAIEQIVSDIKDLGGAGAINPANYAKLVTAVNSFIASIHGSSDWTALFTQVKKLVVDFDALGADAKAAIAKVEAIVAPPVVPVVPVVQ